MPPPEPDPWIAALGSFILFGSLGTWVYLIAKRRRDGYFLRYEPRRAVPWGPAAAVLAILLAALPLLPLLTTGQLDLEPAPAPELEPAEAALRLALSLIPVIFIGALFVLSVAILSRALPTDLGLPNSARQLMNDIGIGLLTCLAAVVPVYAILLVLRLLLQIEEVSRHPLVELVSGSGEVGVLVLATIAAVVVAPVIEELTFRLLLQGWLEKWEMQRPHRLTSYDEPEMTNTECQMTNDGANDSSFVIRHSSFDAGATHGAGPIFVSSLLFALAHFGYGPEPIPIFFLALFIGYVYHRTHRIVPCMVAHAMFNMLSMFILWRTVLTSE